MVLKFLSLLSRINDPRRGQGKKWQLAPVLLATILAILSGANSYRKVHSFIKTHRKRLNKLLGTTWETAPAYNSIRTILHSLDAAEVERVFRLHAAGLNETSPDNKEAGEEQDMPCVAIDGKTLRHSFDAFNDKKAVHVLSALAGDGTLILGHLEVSEKTNEIPAARQLIKELGLEDHLFTLDALHCQKNFCGRPPCREPSHCSG